jgi:hypothetical protein
MIICNVELDNPDYDDADHVVQSDNDNRDEPHGHISNDYNDEDDF